ncbi:MAG: hypothetical protein JSW67_12505 [Candidatus Latescibacterota bacterium]|nr:MAG: hypothetical protein JSW67_12505 [Candidatus Latescibacterota bacterium]
MTSAEDPTTSLDSLIADAVRLVGERYSQPIGRVVERRRGRVFVVVHGEPPRSGVRLLGMRPIPGAPPGRERLIAKLQVQRTTQGLVECKEVERSGREHVEKDDIVRVQGNPQRLLLAPCVALVDLAPVVTQVIGEKLRAAILGRMDVELVGERELEARAERAYWSGSVQEFLGRLDGVDEVLFPVLLQTAGRVLLNLEYYSVERGRAVQIDVAVVDTDAMLRAWLRAGNPRRAAPPGFRLLTTQVFPWNVSALAASPHGGLLAAARDSMHCLDFDYPGLRPTQSLALGARQRRRREPYTLILVHDALEGAVRNERSAWIVSDERLPQALVADGENGVQLQGSLRLDSSRALEDLWVATRGPTPVAGSWWPSPTRGEHPVVEPLFADVDVDGHVDLMWSDARGMLHVQRVAVHRTASFPGFGDVKAVQPGRIPDSRAVLWLTDPVCCGEADRLHAAQLQDAELQLVWSSPPFDGTLVALASHDLNGDAALDLVAAEAVEDGTRFHVFLALPGESTPARGMALSQEGAR